MIYKSLDLLFDQLSKTKNATKTLALPRTGAFYMILKAEVFKAYHSLCENYFHTTGQSD